MKCKAVSLWQPWASLIEAGAKTLETRSWPTSYRGKLVIHAAKLWNQEMADALARPEFQLALGPRFHPPNKLISDVFDFGIHKDALPFGAALCLVDLLDCFRIGDVARTKWMDRLTTQEQAFGDYRPERWAWVLGNPRPLRRPVPLKGRQGVFDCDFGAILTASEYLSPPPS